MWQERNIHTVHTHINTRREINNEKAGTTFTGQGTELALPRLTLGKVHTPTITARLEGRRESAKRRRKEILHRILGQEQAV